MWPPTPGRLPGQRLVLSRAGQRSANSAAAEAPRGDDQPGGGPRQAGKAEQAWAAGQRGRAVRLLPRCRLASGRGVGLWKGGGRDRAAVAGLPHCSDGGRGAHGP